MTTRPLLTDEEILSTAKSKLSLRSDVHPSDSHFFVKGCVSGARFARDVYEARLAEDAKREALWRKLLNHLDEQVIDKLDADGSCSLCKELRAALGLEEIK